MIETILLGSLTAMVVTITVIMIVVGAMLIVDLIRTWR